MCETSQLQQFIDEINATSVCYTPECGGKLFPVNIKRVGLGGSATIQFSCSLCTQRVLILKSSIDISYSKRTVCSLALQVAFIAGGCMHAQYSKILRQHLGLPAVDANTFYQTIKMLHPIVQGMLQELCDEAKLDMKAMDPATIGSWQRAVTTSDGVWLTRGKFSKNSTFTIRNYTNNSLLYFVHLSMRGKVSDTGIELFKGTSKGAEGYAAGIAFGKSKEEGMNIEIQWQDGDSSAAKSFKEHYPNGEVMLCGGHVARAHTKRLEELSKRKSFSATVQDNCKSDYPTVTTVTCHCPKRHSKHCGCLSKAFLRGARTNFFYCLLDSDTNPDTFATRMCVLGKYHARDIHQFPGGQCGFHALKTCNCGQCEEEILCQGEEYHTKNPLTCPFHALAYEIECNARASQSTEIIHKELGRGHSNYPEASHNVLVRFRSKDTNIQCIHYMVTTNLGLLQANMSYLYEKKGASYHWILDLFSRLRLPLLDGMQEALLMANQKRHKNLVKKQSEEGKDARTRWKKARVQEHEERKLWSRQQSIPHTYGSESDNVEDEESSNTTTTSTRIARSTRVRRNHVHVQFAADDSDDECGQNEDRVCTCGSARATHQRSCPLIPRNF